MKAGLLGVLLICLVLAPAGARADGGFIPATAFEKVQIPDQRALIHFADGKETLVIDTAFKGEGTNFAWLLPLPSPPTIEPATTGLFATLQNIFQPNIVHEVFGFYGLVIFLGCVTAYIMWKWHRGESIIGVLVILGLIALLSTMLLPAGLGTASAGVSSSDQIAVIDRRRVGIYDTVTLKSSDGQAIFDWLQQNGFVAPTNAIPAIRAYAREGWCFVASKIHLGAAMRDAATPHPLTLKFQTARPVYPLRLTAVNNDRVRIDLYIFGPSRAEVPHFAVERCAAPSYPNDPNLQPFRRRPGLKIRHPLLRDLVADSPVATKLTANLTHQEMQQDAYVNWTPFQEKLLTRYSTHGAWIVALNIATPILTIGLLIALRRLWAGTGFTFHVGYAMALIAFVAGLAVFISLPKTPVVASHRPTLFMYPLHNYLIPSALTGLADGETNVDAVWFKQKLEPASDFRKTLSAFDQTNLFTGEIWRDEDSPGNYSIRTTPNGIDYLWYDIEGGQHALPLNAQPVKK